MRGASRATHEVGSAKARLRSAPRSSRRGRRPRRTPGTGRRRSWIVTRGNGWPCVTTRARRRTYAGEQSPEVLDLRMACLDDRRQALEALTRVLAQADKQSVSKAVDAVRALPALDRCADVRLLRDSRVPFPNADVAARAADLRRRAAATKAMFDLGDQAWARARPGSARGGARARTCAAGGRHADHGRPIRRRPGIRRRSERAATRVRTTGADHPPRRHRRRGLPGARGIIPLVSSGREPDLERCRRGTARPGRARAGPSAIVATQRPRDRARDTAGGS